MSAYATGNERFRVYRLGERPQPKALLQTLAQPTQPRFQVVLEQLGELPLDLTRSVKPQVVEHSRS